MAAAFTQTLRSLRSSRVPNLGSRFTITHQRPYTRLSSSTPQISDRGTFTPLDKGIEAKPLIENASNNGLLERLQAVFSKPSAREVVSRSAKAKQYLTPTQLYTYTRAHSQQVKQSLQENPQASLKEVGQRADAKAREAVTRTSRETQIPSSSKISARTEAKPVDEAATRLNKSSASNNGRFGWLQRASSKQSGGDTRLSQFDPHASYVTGRAKSADQQMAYSSQMKSRIPKIIVENPHLSYQDCLKLAHQQSEQKVFGIGQ